MKRGLVLLVLVGLAATAAAMVPYKRIQRAVYNEEESSPTGDGSPTGGGTPNGEGSPAGEVTPIYCQSQTPCAWRMFKPKTDTIVNKYCVCTPGYSCLFSEEDSINMQTFHCRPPPDESTTGEEESAFS